MLTITGLKAGYGGQAVVSLPDIKLHQGQSCLLKGRSGSGKTTILQTLAGLSAPIAGAITLNGCDIHTLSESRRDHLRGQKMGIIFQTLHLIKSLNVTDNIRLSSHMAALPQKPERILSLLEKLGIKDLADRPATSLSQGQAQRVAIARALINSPELILADEPTSSLDDEACSQTMSLLQTLAREAGAILIVSSHDGRITPSFDQTITLES
jgi:putative ABC transport system ATP-binding protein